MKRIESQKMKAARTKRPIESTVLQCSGMATEHPGLSGCLVQSFPFPVSARLRNGIKNITKGVVHLDKFFLICLISWFLNLVLRVVQPQRDSPTCYPRIPQWQFQNPLCRGARALVIQRFTEELSRILSTAVYTAGRIVYAKYTWGEASTSASCTPRAASMPIRSCGGGGFKLNRRASLRRRQRHRALRASLRR